MSSAPITLVAGLSGSGKTTWIHQRLSEQTSAVYLALGAEASIDDSYLSIEFPALQVLHKSPELPVARTVLEQVAAGLNVYIEIGFHIDLNLLQLPFATDLCQRVALVPPNHQEPSFVDWADEVLLGEDFYGVSEVDHLWRSALTGQILDPASLDTFWYELIQGAYGLVDRAKGIFDLVDGQAFYFNYVKGFPKTQYVELKLPRWAEGRPTRFSGMEVVGAGLDPAGIAATLTHCGLEDAAIAHYQAQIKESLGEKAA